MAARSVTTVTSGPEGLAGVVAGVLVVVVGAEESLLPVVGVVVVVVPVVVLVGVVVASGSFTEKRQCPPLLRSSSIRSAAALRSNSLRVTPASPSYSTVKILLGVSTMAWM